MDTTKHATVPHEQDEKHRCDSVKLVGNGQARPVDGTPEGHALGQKRSAPAAGAAAGQAPGTTSRHLAIPSSVDDIISTNNNSDKDSGSDGVGGTGLARKRRRLMGVFSRARDRDREKERDRDAGKVAAVEDESLTCGGRQVVPSNAMAASASAPASGLGLAPSVTKTPATSLAEEKFLIDFVANYSAGPACLLQGASAVDKPLDVRAHNAVFNPKHAGALQQLATLGKLATEPTGRTEVFSWSFTPLPGDRLVCLGTAKRPPLHPSQDSSESVPGRSTLDAINAAGQSPSATSRLRRTPKEEKVQPHRRDGERWFEIWAGLKVPGISPEDQAAHLDLLRNIDFSATELGPIDSWCPELLNSFTECLASPFPVLLAWGRDPMICKNDGRGTSGVPYMVTQTLWAAGLTPCTPSLSSSSSRPPKPGLYNFPYGINIGPSKHPKLLGGNYKDSFGERTYPWQRLHDSKLSAESPHWIVCLLISSLGLGVRRCGGRLQRKVYAR